MIKPQLRLVYKFFAYNCVEGGSLTPVTNVSLWVGGG